jgi:hypothetical protein
MDRFYGVDMLYQFGSNLEIRRGVSMTGKKSMIEWPGMIKKIGAIELPGMIEQAGLTKSVKMIGVDLEIKK